MYVEEWIDNFIVIAHQLQLILLIMVKYDHVVDFFETIKHTHTHYATMLVTSLHTKVNFNFLTYMLILMYSSN